MEAVVKTETRKKYMHAIIGVLIMAIFHFIPAPAPMTALGMRALGVFIGTVYLWITVDMFWPSILAIFMYAFIGYVPMSGAIAMSLGNDTVWMTIMTMALLGMMGQIGLTEHIVAFFLSKKFLKGRPWVFAFTFFILEAVLSACVNSMISALLMWQLLVSIRDITGYKNGEPWLALMTVGVCLDAAIAGCLVPFNGLMLFLNNILTNAIGYGADYVKYMCFSFPIFLVMIGVFLLMMRFVFRVDVTPLKELDPDVFVKDLGPMTAVQKAMLAIFAGLFVCLCAGPYLPKASWLGAKYAMISFSGIVVFFFILASVIRIDGKPICDFQKTVATVPWGMVCMIAVAMSISTVLLSEEAGIKAYIVGILSPMLHGVSPLVFIIIVLALAALLTNVSNNLVVAFVFVPILIAINAITPLPVVAYTALLCFAVNFALILPSGSPTAAMLYSHEMNNHKKHFLYTITTVVVEVVVLIAVGVPLASFFLN